jgi:alpha-mannosidase
MERRFELSAERVEKWLSPIYWTDVNIQSVLNSKPIQLSSICGLIVPELARISVSSLLTKESEGELRFSPISIGDSFGPSWTTVWFRITLPSLPTLPSGRKYGLRWNSDSEAMLYSADGQPIQAFTGGNGSDCRDLCVIEEAVAGTEYLVEMACNGMFGNGDGGMIKPPNPNRTFNLHTAHITVINEAAQQLFWDMTVLHQLMLSLKSHHPASQAACTLANEIIDNVILSNESSILDASERCRSLLWKDFELKATPTEVVVIGHCHIDTAWLWPYAETRRKILRSWTTQTKLLEQYPHWRFGASQSVQWAWLQQDSPVMFQKVLRLVEQGRFVPLGGSYVEFDANVPSGESMVRQFLYGMEYFKRELGVQPRVFWLPDTFGYSAQLPQIMLNFGIPYFMTQKLSWNLVNR